LDQRPKIALRKADFWTGIVILVIAVMMIVEALGYPLEGSYAGVRNVWYVSPALFPLMTAGMLVLLSTYLLLNAVREGGLAAALTDLNGGRIARAARASADVWIVALILGSYIYVLVPRIDFPLATLFVLFTFFAVYHVAGRALLPALGVFVAAGLTIVATAAAGFQPAPRSAAFYTRDAALLAAILLQIALVTLAVRADPPARACLRRSLAVAILTPLLLSVVFKYGLIVPLPAEGLATEAMERIRYGRF
jgi:hypothetical protein